MAVERLFPAVYEAWRPAEGHNNLWYERNNTDRVCIFVHGVLSDSEGCWYRKNDAGQPGVYWPALLANDPEFRQYSIYLGGYFTKFTAREYGVADCADELFRALAREDKGIKPALSRSTLMFVCHSTGGIVVRYMLDAHPQEFANKTIGLALIASPSYGSRWASALPLRVVGKIYRHAVAQELSWASPIVSDLDDRFRNLLDEHRIPRLDGVEACENHFLFRRKYLPPLPLLVKRESAGRYFGRTTTLPDTDHATAVKPDSRDHPAYTFLRDFRLRFEKKFLKSSIELGVPNVVHNPRGNYVCSCLQWDVEIDADGDAANELCYRDVVLLDQQPNNWLELPTAEVQSGQLQPYELSRDSRTSQGVSLVITPNGARTLDVRVQFSNRPTSLRPSSFCLSNCDLNAFSMNTDEFKAKPNFRSDFVDYAEKLIDEDVGLFSLTIRFPGEMQLLKLPYLEVYEYAGTDAKLHDGLTSAYQSHFSYSPLLRTAVLKISRPAAPYAYRISWQLGSCPELGSATANPLIQFRARNFKTAVLDVRDYVISGNGSQNTIELAKFIAATVTSFLDYFRELIREKLGSSATLDPMRLSFSLMVPSADGKQLVVGTGNTEDKTFVLDIGDGNAGRAWKRGQVRVFDRKLKESKTNAYFPPKAGPPHEFLFSIPLVASESKSFIYAVVNVGTYDEAQAELLRVLGTTEYIEQLGTRAQSYLSQRLIERIQ